MFVCITGCMSVCVCDSVCPLGCMLTGRAVSDLDHHGSFTLLLTDSEHSDDKYSNLQRALKLVFSDNH